MASRSQRDLPSACCRDTAVELSVGGFRPGVGRFDVAFPDSPRQWSAASSRLAVRSGEGWGHGLAQILPGVAAERINIDVFRGTILQGVMTIHSASPLSAPQRNPIGSAVAGSSKTFRVHQGLQQDWPITVALFPVLRKLPRTTRKN